MGLLTEFRSTLSIREKKEEVRPLRGHVRGSRNMNHYGHDHDQNQPADTHQKTETYAAVFYIF